MALKIDDISINTIIGNGSSISGDVHINGFIRIDGDIDGKENDPSIIFINRTGKKVYTDNIIINNARLIRKLSVITGIGQSLMIGINIVNNNCRCGVKTTAKNAYIIQANKFKNLVKAIESRQIGDINKEQLDAAVKAVNKLNRRKKLNAKK